MCVCVCNALFTKGHVFLFRIVFPFSHWFPTVFQFPFQQMQGGNACLTVIAQRRHCQCMVISGLISQTYLQEGGQDPYPPEKSGAFPFAETTFSGSDERNSTCQTCPVQMSCMQQYMLQCGHVKCAARRIKPTTSLGMLASVFSDRHSVKGLGVDA